MRVASERWSGKTGTEIFMCKVDISILRTTLRLWSNRPKRSMLLTDYVFYYLLYSAPATVWLWQRYLNHAHSFIHSFIAFQDSDSTYLPALSLPVEQATDHLSPSISVLCRRLHLPPPFLESCCLHFWLQISSPSIPWLPLFFGGLVVSTA